MIPDDSFNKGLPRSIEFLIAAAGLVILLPVFAGLRNTGSKKFAGRDNFSPAASRTRR